jgi:hypothetical protein
MNCDECKNLITYFMDSELDETQAAAVRSHLADCALCAKVCEDITSILDVCGSESPVDILPPNSNALWCRINNVIEHEVRPDAVPDVTPAPRRFWQLSFGQLAAAVVFVAVISSLLTIVGIKTYLQPSRSYIDAASTAAPQGPFEKVLSRVGLMETPQQARDRRLQEQKAAIEYWNARVQSRREQWDRATREAFDRNLQVIDESVNDYTVILQKDPDDELTGEMLDTVLNDKMNLLRDFSDL